MVAGDAHMLAMDDGTNTDYSDAGGAGCVLLLLLAAPCRACVREVLTFVRLGFLCSMRRPCTGLAAAKCACVRRSAAQCGAEASVALAVRALIFATCPPRVAPIPTAATLTATTLTTTLACSTFVTILRRRVDPALTGQATGRARRCSVTAPARHLRERAFVAEGRAAAPLSGPPHGW